MANKGVGEIFTKLTEIPMPTSAYYHGKDGIQINASSRDYTQKSVRNFRKSVLRSLSLCEYVEFPFLEVKGEIFSARSPSGTFLAILREESGCEQRRFVEVWAKDRIILSTEVTKKHGLFYSNKKFASISFSPEETSLFYVAENNRPWLSEKIYEAFEYMPTLGESMKDFRNPAIFMVQWDISGKVEAGQHPLYRLDIPSRQDGVVIFFTQPRCCTDRKDVLYCTGYETSLGGRLLGQVHCNNRPSGIWEVKLSTLSTAHKGENESVQAIQCTAKKLTPSYLSCFSPTVTKLDPSMKEILVFLASQSGGPHRSTSMLCSIDCETNDLKTIVGNIDEPDPISSFPGLHVEDFVSTPFIKLERSQDQPRAYMVATTIWGSRSTIVLIDLNEGEVRDLTPIQGAQVFSWSVQATEEGRLLCMRSSPVSPPAVLEGKIDPRTYEIDWKLVWQVVLSPEVAHQISRLTSSIIKVPHRHPVEALVLQSPNTHCVIPPMILSPHGGPHSTSIADFNMPNIAMALSGYTIVNPNYTGSLGFGKHWIDALLCQCGSLDVEDCISTVDYLVGLGLAQDRPGSLFVAGGSHGGFLTGHLIGRYPTKFTRAVLINPVIAPHEPGTSDIPDWYLNEFIGANSYPLKSLPPFNQATSHDAQSLPLLPLTPDTISKLYERSVTRYLPSIKTPSLLLVGGSDLRVAPTQGLEFYYALKARGVETELLVFPDQSHAIDSVEALRARIVATIDWFQAETRPISR